MCIVIFKNAGADAPSDEIIQTCWDNNPDGAGVMVLRPKEKYVEYQKGCMELKEFQYVLGGLSIKKEDFVAYHFRIATSGGVNKGMTHPFPVTQYIDVLKSLSGRFPRVFMHNGVLGQGTPELSDTALFVKDRMTHMEGLFNNKKVIATKTNGSRTITFDAKEGILMTGSWVEDKGLSFSNSTYKETYYSKNWWNDYPGWYTGRGKYFTGGKDTYAKYCKLSDENEGWSDEAFDYCGCGYGHRSKTYCSGCEFQTICDRGVTALESKYTPDVCDDFIPRSDRTVEVCAHCRYRHSCMDRVIDVPRKQKQWIEGKGYCIAVY